MALERVRRFDKAERMGKCDRMENGMLRAPARLTRAGVFEYMQADGKISRELRLPEEVFKPESLASFDLMPLTNNHPTEGNGAVTAANAKRLSVGSVGHVCQDKEDPNYVAGIVLITDADAIGSVDAGKVELSCGYFCDREPAIPGATFTDPVTGKNTPYDVIQRNIRGNHVALVVRGRAGSEARIMLDASDAFQVDSDAERVMVTRPGVFPTTKEEGRTMLKITIDGVTYEVAPQVSEALAKERKITADALALAQANATALKVDLEKATARADAAESTTKKQAEEIKNLTDPKAISEKIAARVALESVATSHAVKCDGLTDAEIRSAVIAKIDPAIKLDGKSADYTLAMFDALTRANRPSLANTLTTVAGGAVKADAAPMDSAARKAAYNAAFFAPVK